MSSIDTIFSPLGITGYISETYLMLVSRRPEKALLMAQVADRPEFGV